MGNEVYDQIPARKVKAGLRMGQHAHRVSGNVSPTCWFFGVRVTVLDLEETLLKLATEPSSGWRVRCRFGALVI